MTQASIGLISHGSRASRRVSSVSCSFHLSNPKHTFPPVPIILKGIATWEDAVLACEAGVQGIVLSNHGGRQLDMARSGVEVLLEVTEKLRERGLWPNPNFHIFVDGGVRRATDVLKALALGASAVGIGRGFLYSFCSYGQDGVEHAFKILRDEFEMNMRLLGITKLDQLRPEMVDARALAAHMVPTPSDNLFGAICKLYLAGTNEKVRLSNIIPFSRSTTCHNTIQGVQVVKKSFVVLS